MLLNRCLGIKKSFWGKSNSTETPTSTNWWAIAHVYSDSKVLENLSSDEKGKLLGKWTSVLEQIAQLLGELWSANEIARDTMIVKRGNDSSTWNSTAGAWNKARDNWMNLIYSLGLDYVLDDLCFGKALRLMAADVASWHRSADGGLEPNTVVWNEIPLPWEIFNGSKSCNKEMVIRACQNAGLNPEKSGWIAPREVKVSEFRPTPELVHGVTVYNPFLATVLKRHKFFSGKTGHAFDPKSN